MPPPPRKTIIVVQKKKAGSIALASSTTGLADQPTLSPVSDIATSISSTRGSARSSRVRKLAPGRTAQHAATRPAITTVETLVRTQTQTSELTRLSTESTAFSEFHRIDSGIPDPPIWFIYFISACLAFGFCAAILLYFVNFPPRLGRRKGQGRYGYSEVEQEDRGFGYRSSSSMSDDRKEAAAFTTSAHTPTLHARRRRQDNLDIDTTARYHGLGLALPGSGQEFDARYLRPRRSFDSRDDIETRSTSPARSVAVLQALTAPIPSARSFLHSASRSSSAEDAVYALQSRQSDLEDGLLSSDARNRLSPEGSPQISQLSSSVTLLTKVGDKIEYAADRFAKMLHDQVRGDPEDGLLLPVRDSEREVVDNPHLKKLY